MNVHEYTKFESRVKDLAARIGMERYGIQSHDENEIVQMVECLYVQLVTFYKNAYDDGRQSKWTSTHRGRGKSPSKGMTK